MAAVEGGVDFDLGLGEVVGDAGAGEEDGACWVGADGFGELVEEGLVSGREYQVRISFCGSGFWMYVAAEINVCVARWASPSKVRVMKRHFLRIHTLNGGRRFWLSRIILGHTSDPIHSGCLQPCFSHSMSRRHLCSDRWESMGKCCCLDHSFPTSPTMFHPRFAKFGRTESAESCDWQVDGRW